MPMIGGEAAESSVLARRPVSGDARDPFALGWVIEWLSGDAVLPPLPVDPRAVAPAPRRHLTPVSAILPAAPAHPRPHAARVRERRLVLI